MNVLILAPHPFFKERGTPIAVLELLKVLSERKTLKVDVLVYHEGIDVELPDNVTIYRIPSLKFVKNLRPGFSLKKIICDFFFFISATKLVRKNDYKFIHAIEESVFFALLFKFFKRIPYVYDLDSSLAQQVVEKIPVLKLFSFLLNYFEARAIRGSIINLPVCNALVELCEKRGSAKTVIVPDISQLKNPGLIGTGFLKKELGIKNEILLYIGNLEPYQGIDLLLESFKIVCGKIENLDLVIVGGDKDQIKVYRKKTIQLNINKKTHFLGARPFNQLQTYLAEADIIASPRIRGVNTPMKIYPFLHSGKAVIATNLYTHTQMLTDNEAYLAPPSPEGFAKGILLLAKDKLLREKLGKNGMSLIEKNYTFPAHKERITKIYDWIENERLNEQTKEDLNIEYLGKNLKQVL